MQSEHDLAESIIVRDEDRLSENDKGPDQFHTQVVSMVQSKVPGGHATRIINLIDRKTCWKDDKLAKVVDMYSAPTEIRGGGGKMKVRSRSLGRRKSVVVPTVRDKCVLATKISQVSEAETKVEILFDLCCDAVITEASLSNNKAYRTLSKMQVSESSGVGGVWKRAK